MDTQTKQTTEARLAKMDDDELEAELEAAVDLKDEAERQGDSINYHNQHNYVVLIRREINLRELLTEDLPQMAAA